MTKLNEVSLTAMETHVLNAIVAEEGGDNGGWGPTLDMLVDSTSLKAKVLRGVLGSLVVKGKIVLDEGFDEVPTVYCSN